MAKITHFNEQFRSLMLAIGYLGALPFYLLLATNWFGASFASDFYDPIWLFRFYSIAILAFMTGAIWGLGFSLQNENESFQFRPIGLLLGSVFILLSGVGVLLLKPSVGIFIAALLYLVLWQIELKTNLARLYPEWYWVLRTKLTMLVAASHILLWLTIG